MAIANLHERIQASILRRNQLNLELTELQTQKSLAVYSQADVQSLLSSEKHAVRDYFKGLYDDDEALQESYLNYTEIPDFEEQIQVVEKTIADLGANGKPGMIVFNKIDAYTYVEKAEDDLTPKTKENISLDELMKTWMSKLNDNCIFISAREKINLEELKTVIYNKVRELHVQKYPYNDFLYQTYDESEMSWGLNRY